MIARCFATTLTLTLAAELQVIAQPLLHQIQRKYRGNCEPIAYIFNSATNNRKNTICKGDNLKVSSGSVFVYCLASRETSILTSSGVIDRVCLPQKKQTQNPSQLLKCSTNNARACDPVKGDEVDRQQELVILLPDQDFPWFQTRPRLYWEAIPGATSYEVTVIGNQVSWQISTIKTSLPYPPNKPALNYLSAYLIVISAKNQDGTTIAKARRVINLVSEAEAKQMISNDHNQLPTSTQAPQSFGSE
jgi:hypothetical protein